jgi:hypothetical protein
MRTLWTTLERVIRGGGFTFDGSESSPHHNAVRTFTSSRAGLPRPRAYAKTS